jgi:hypothetical protein
LPVAFGDPLRLKGDARGFAHAAYMAMVAQPCQRQMRAPSKGPTLAAW